MMSSDLTLVINGRRHEAVAYESIVALQQTWQTGNRLILLFTCSTPISSTELNSESDLSASTLQQKVLALQSILPIELISLETSNFAQFKQVFTSIATQFVAYVPTGCIPSSTLPVRSAKPSLSPWIPALPFPSETACESAIAVSAWMITTSLLKSIESQLQQESDYTLLNIAHCLEAVATEFTWRTAVSPHTKSITATTVCSPPRVLAIVPHYGCEQWLSQCLRSLLHQTRLPDNIVVVDDGSPNLPIDIVRQFPTVTLLAAPGRVGPYRLIQQVIEDTNYWAYLFQDADDWSSSDRLQKLLMTMEATGCELVGTQELRVVESELLPVCYPLDVNRALAEKPGHGLLHPTSLVTRDLVMRVGGFATGLAFGGDTEFLLRAVLVAQIANIPDYAYFRRKRPGSLTTDPQTGLGSPARQTLIQQCKARAIANHTALQAGQPPCLTPLLRGEPIQLRHVLGPKLLQV
jgi:hypothetical protein